MSLIENITNVIEEMYKVRQSVYQNVELLDEAIWRLNRDDQSK